MELNTKPFGKITIDENQIISFSKGIFGFEDIKEYALLDASQRPFWWLQSVGDVHPAFLLIDPFTFRSDYTIDVDANELAEIDLKENEKDKILVFAIVTVPLEQNRMSANLQGPVIINKEKKIGRQLISTNQKWKVKHYIMDELSGSTESGGAQVTAESTKGGN